MRIAKPLEEPVAERRRPTPRLAPHAAAGVDLAAARDALRAAAYTQSEVAALVRPLGPGQRMDAEVVARRAAGDRPAAALTRLFVLGQSVPAGLVQRAIGTRATEALARGGLLRIGRGSVRATAKLAPYHDLYVISDFDAETRSRRMTADHVLGVGPASVTLANLTPRRRVGTALDVGTGAGIQALLAGSHAAQVLGTDTNRRALDFAAFNTQMNGYANIDLSPGSFFEPVAGRTFDLVVCNPPFVISPESRLVFRDSGLGGDEVCGHVVSHAARHLNPGGMAVILVNWFHSHDDDWDAKPVRWVAGTGCDAWVLCFDTDDAAMYAGRWLRSMPGRDAHFGAKLDAWLAYYAGIGAIRFSAGAVILRRPAGSPPWVRTDRIRGGLHTGECGTQILRIFEAETLLRGLSGPEALLDVPLRLCREHMLEHRLRVEDGRWALQSESLKLSQGFSFAGDIDVHVMDLLANCDGIRPLRGFVPEVAARVGAAVPDVVRAIAAVLGKLLRSGILEAGADAR